MPNPADYLAFLSKDLHLRSELIREWFATHRPSAGSSREELITDLLRDLLPDRFTVSSGLALSRTGEFSRQADILITDGYSGRPLFNRRTVPVWLIESVYALIEVKTNLTKKQLTDGMAKCQRFKSLPRNFSSFSQSAIRESLCVLWAYEAPSSKTFMENLADAVADLADEHLPDFIIVPNRFLLTSGDYRRLALYGQRGSDHRNAFAPHLGPTVPLRPFDFAESDTHSLLFFYTYLMSWLGAAGPRSAEINRYLDQQAQFGRSRAGMFLRRTD